MPKSDEPELFDEPVAVEAAERQAGESAPKRKTARRGPARRADNGAESDGAAENRGDSGAGERDGDRQEESKRGDGSEGRGGDGQRQRNHGRGRGQGRQQNRNYQNRHQQKKKQQPKNKKKGRKGGRQRGRGEFYGVETGPELQVGSLAEFELFNDLEAMESLAAECSENGDALKLNTLMAMPLAELADEARAFGVELNTAPNRIQLMDRVMERALDQKHAIEIEGILETTEDGYGLLAYERDDYKIKSQNAFVPESLIERYGLRRGHIISAQLHPHRESESCPFVLKVNSVMGHEADKDLEIEPFEDLVPYYPLQRILLETEPDVPWDNLSMRVVDLLTPIGFGQRGLIVAPPRTGKTMILQGIANSVAKNYPEAHLIVLLVDERPEEVTDFERQVKGEVISSTFDEAAESHVHCAEMVIEKSRRLVESGRDVVILLDSITRLARAYNTLMPSSGKILSGGVEASALQKPKRFFGSARNIEEGGSLTILATALIDTGSRMDEVIFEEFKGTGNMELHLDRALVDKRIFPAINLEQSGTRKEELLYHPDELNKIYSLRRAMKGVPSPEAMEMLIQRVKKTKTNAEFLMGMNR